jgi:hypothetical protein
VWQIRQNKRISEDAGYREIANFIMKEELTGVPGTFIKTVPDRRHLLFSGVTHRMYAIDVRDADYAGYIWLRYGLFPTEKVTRHVTASLHAYCNVRGEERETRRFVYFDAQEHVLYVSRNDGSAYRLDGRSIGVVANGGKVMFMDDYGGSTPVDPSIGPHGMLLPTLVDGLQYVASTQGGMRPEEQKLALTCWLFAVAFPDLMPSKPMLLIEGDKGAGKTLAVQLIQNAIHGKVAAHIVGKSDERDLPVQLLRRPICLLDNTDSFVDWLQDSLCAYATSGEWARRKLYTDHDDVVLKPHSFIAIASKNPITFKRDDVADRCIILRLSRRTANIPAYALFAEVARMRRQLYGEWLYYLNQIVAEIRASRHEQVVSTQLHRMADFAYVAHVIGRVLGKSKDEIDLMLDAIQAEREVLASEGDPLADCLDRWLEREANVGRSVLVADLFHELAELAAAKKMSFYRSPATLAQKLRNPALTKHFTISDGGTKAGAKLYQFRRTG